MTTEIHAIGTFEVKSGALRISDPCYGRDVRADLAGTVPAKNGRWCAFVETYCGRVAALCVVHIGLPRGPHKATSFNAGVDSGLLGVFDDAAFDDSATTTFDFAAPARVVDGAGVISSTGVGDGLYLVGVISKSKTKLATALCVIFIDKTGPTGELARGMAGMLGGCVDAIEPICAGGKAAVRTGRAAAQ